MKKILFVCLENAGRSQMAEAFMNHLGTGRIEASSAGTMPIDHIHSNVVEAMKEKGIDLSGKTPKLINTKMIQEADRVIVMGCGAEGFCPAHLLDRVTDWEIEDPKDKPIGKVRQIRDEVERRVNKLIKEIT